MKLAIFSLFFGLSAFALNNNEMAPNFNLNGSHGKTSLADQKGKYVVLEWYNDGCPFVRKHYDSNNMQKLQKKYKDNVQWITINSSAEGKQGHLSDVKAAKKMFTQEQMVAMNLLLDSDGKVGKAYKAKTTPHMYIISPKGKLVYQGAIDSVPSANASDIPGSQNFVAMALDQALAGKPIKRAKTTPYGCSVKY